MFPDTKPTGIRMSGCLSAMEEQLGYALKGPLKGSIGFRARIDVVV